MLLIVLVSSVVYLVSPGHTQTDAEWYLFPGAASSSGLGAALGGSFGGPIGANELYSPSFGGGPQPPPPPPPPPAFNQGPDRLKPRPVYSAAANIISEMGENQSTGTVTFTQYAEYGPVVTSINVTGLMPDKTHAIHIHTYGDTADGCNSTGPHYRQSVVGNGETNEMGNLELEFQSPYLHLSGPGSIIGRSIVFHEKPIKYNRFPDIMPVPTELQVDYPMATKTEEQAVGGIISCGIITIKKNSN